MGVFVQGNVINTHEGVGCICARQCNKHKRGLGVGVFVQGNVINTRGGFGGGCICARHWNKHRGV